ncbi:hypothetical protein D3C71_2026340 [compost metagenome]
MVSEVMNCPMGVRGTMSPKPVVVSVTMAQYMLTGMLVKPCCGPSTTYMMVPRMIVMMNTVPRNTKILRRLLDSAMARLWASSK